jgi:hypothetical protein
MSSTHQASHSRWSYASEGQIQQIATLLVEYGADTEVTVSDLGKDQITAEVALTELHPGWQSAQSWLSD